MLKLTLEFFKFEGFYYISTIIHTHDRKTDYKIKKGFAKIR